MRKHYILATLLMIATASSAFAQLPPGRWWRRPEVINLLALSADQQEKLEAIYLAAAPDLIDARGEVEKQNLALRGELDRPQLDRNAVRAAARRVNEARGKQFDRELTMLVDMRSVLTEPQWNRMRAELSKKLEEGPNARRVNPNRPNMQKRRGMQ